MAVIDLATRAHLVDSEAPDFSEVWDECGEIYDRAIVLGFKHDGDVCITGIGDITVETSIYLMERAKIALLASED